MSDWFIIDKMGSDYVAYVLGSAYILILLRMKYDTRNRKTVYARTDAG